MPGPLNISLKFPAMDFEREQEDVAGNDLSIIVVLNLLFCSGLSVVRSLEMYDVERTSVQLVMNHGTSRNPRAATTLEKRHGLQSSECLIAAQTPMRSVVEPCKGTW